jgi:hypothetical protein
LLLLLLSAGLLLPAALWLAWHSSLACQARKIHQMWQQTNNCLLANPFKKAALFLATAVMHNPMGLQAAAGYTALQRVGAAGCEKQPMQVASCRTS